MIPLVDRFPALGRIPRAPLTTTPTPVVALSALAPELWIKRDDLCAAPIGGNKVRALEFLLGDVVRGDRVVTVGSAGSTHALTVATYGERLGLDVRVGRWRQEMNETAGAVAARTASLARAAPVFPAVALAYAWAFAQRLRGARWIAAGGSTPLGILGHVNAGLELVAQIDAGGVPAPRRVIVPLGTGGTLAGLTLAFAIAARGIEVVGVRVVPRIVANERHVRRLIDRTASFIERQVGSGIGRPRADAFSISHGEYGGAYGRETRAARDAANALRQAYGVTLDATYAAKAFAHALSFGGNGSTLFWLTFDSRSLASLDPHAQ